MDDQLPPADATGINPNADDNSSTCSTGEQHAEDPRNAEENVNPPEEETILALPFDEAEILLKLDEEFFYKLVDATKCTATMEELHNICETALEQTQNFIDEGLEALLKTKAWDWSIPAQVSLFTTEAQRFCSTQKDNMYKSLKNSLIALTKKQQVIQKLKNDITTLKQQTSRRKIIPHQKPNKDHTSYTPPPLLCATESHFTPGVSILALGVGSELNENIIKKQTNDSKIQGKKENTDTETVSSISNDVNKERKIFLSHSTPRVVETSREVRVVQHVQNQILNKTLTPNNNIHSNKHSKNYFFSWPNSRSQDLAHNSDLKKRKVALYKKSTDMDALLLGNPIYEISDSDEPSKLTTAKRPKLVLSERKSNNTTLSFAGFNTVNIAKVAAEEVPEVFVAYAPTEKLFDCAVSTDQILQVQKINKASGYTSPYENVSFLSAAETCSTHDFSPAFNRNDQRCMLPTHNAVLQVANQICQFAHHVEQSIKTLDGSKVAQDPKFKSLLETISNHTSYLGVSVFHALGKSTHARKTVVFHEILGGANETLPKHYASQQLAVKNAYSSTKDEITFTGIKLFDFMDWSKERHRGELLAKKSLELSNVSLRPNFNRETIFRHDSNHAAGRTGVSLHDRLRGNRNYNGNFNHQNNRFDKENHDHEVNKKKELTGDDLKRYNDLVQDLQKLTGQNGSILDTFAPHRTSERGYYRKPHFGKNN